MLIVTVELLSALTGKRTNLGTMHIANVGGTRTRGDYEGKAYQKGYQPAVGLQEQGSTRKGQVKGYGRIAEPVWSLVLSMLESMGYRGGRGVKQPADVVNFQVGDTVAEELVSDFEDCVRRWTNEARQANGAYANPVGDELGEKRARLVAFLKGEC